MSSPYHDKLQKVEDAIIRQCKASIEENFGQLDMWLSFEDWEFPHIYKTEFNKEFSVYISQDSATEIHIYYAGQNLTYFVSTIMDVSKSLKKINSLVEKFIKAQIEDFDNSCDYISMTMYNENNPDTDETALPVIANNIDEDNPSSS